jgi:hypothetical protein
MRNLIRLAGAVLGALGFIVAASLIHGAWRFVVGTAVFFVYTFISDRIWGRHASREGIRQDLEDRARDILP